MLKSVIVALVKKSNDCVLTSLFIILLVKFILNIIMFDLNQTIMATIIKHYKSKLLYC